MAIERGLTVSQRLGCIFLKREKIKEKVEAIRELK